MEYLNSDNLGRWIRLLSFLSKEKHLILWGTGEFSNKLTRILIENGFLIGGYVDNKSRQGQFHGKPILTPSELFEENSVEPKFVVISSSFFNEISTQCEQAGLCEYSDYMLPLELGYYTNDCFDAHLSVSTENVPHANSYLNLVKNYISSHYIRPGSTVIDVGAHIGRYTQFFSYLLKGEGRVLSFEANPKAFKELASEFQSNELVRVHNCAVSNLSGLSVEMKIYPDDNARSACATVEPALMNQSRMPGDTSIVHVNTRKLDDFVKNGEIQDCSFIKIDVEGHEYAVLEGSKNLIECFSPVVIFEYGFVPNQFCPGTIRQMESLDYLVFDCKNLKKVSPGYIAKKPTDLVAVPKSRIHEFEQFVNSTPEFLHLDF